MKIAILLPYKEDYTKKYAGAVSIHVANLLKHSIYKKSTLVFGNTNRKQYLSNNFINIKINSNILSSNNKKYLSKFIDLNKNDTPDIIEIHNRPSYVNTIKKNLNTKIILYFHNNPLNIAGSKNTNDRLLLLKNCEHIFFNSKWTKDQFFKNLNQNDNLNKFSICYQSKNKEKVNLKKKKKIITFVGKLNSAKGYDVFGQSVIQILNKYPTWKSIVVGDEPRENLSFSHKNLKIYNFKENKFVLNLLKQASISVACSRWEEPFGRSSLEACSMGCATIITDRGGLVETTKYPIILKNLDDKSLFKLLEKLIVDTKYRKKIQLLNYNSFKLTHQYVSKIIDNVRKKIIFQQKIIININKNSTLKILHITNFNQRHYGRLHYNTGKRINNGFTRLGHNVLTISDRDITFFSKSFSDPSGSKSLEKHIINNFNFFRPDVVVLGHADKVSSETLHNLKEINKNLKVIQWFLDPLSKRGPDHKKNKDRILNNIDFIDTTFLTTSPDNLEFDIKNSYFIPNPCDESFEVLKNYQNDCYYDIFFAMSHGVHRGVLKKGKIDEREIFIKKISEKTPDLKYDLYGIDNNQPIWGDDFLKIISNSKMGINLSRGKPIKYYSSDRIVQLIGNGLLTFIHKNTHYQDFFTNKEMIFYNNDDDLIEKLKKYSKDTKQRKLIAKNGRNKYHKYFNSTLVSKFMLDKTYSFNSNNKYLWD